MYRISYVTSQSRVRRQDFATIHRRCRFARVPRAVSLSISVSLSLSLYLYIYIYIYIHVYRERYIYIYIYAYTYIYIYMYVYIYIYIYIYILNVVWALRSAPLCLRRRFSSHHAPVAVWSTCATRSRAPACCARGLQKCGTPSLPTKIITTKIC